MCEFGRYPCGRHDRRSQCGIKSGIDYDKLIVEVAIGCQANRGGLAQ
jgi:hypothetical protein